MTQPSAAASVTGSAKRAYPLLADKRCLRSRHISSSCLACVDACPAKALQIADRKLMFSADRCTGCRTCASVCGEEAILFFPSEWSSETSAQTVSDAMSSAIKKAFAQEAEKPSTILFASRTLPKRLRAEAAAKENGAAAVEVDALNDISIDVLVEAAALGRGALKKVKLVGSSIDACDRSVALQAALADAEAIAESFGMPFSIKVERMKPSVDRSKRALFRRFLAAGRDDACAEPKTSHSATETPEKAYAAKLVSEHDVKLSAKRTRFIEALLSLRKGVQEKELAEPGKPAAQFFGDLAIDADACIACDVCSTVCPSGALESMRAERKDQASDKTRTSVEIHWHPSACTACGLCRDVCFKNAVKIAPAADLDSVLKNISEERLAVFAVGKPKLDAGKLPVKALLNDDPVTPDAVILFSKEESSGTADEYDVWENKLGRMINAPVYRT